MGKQLKTFLFAFLLVPALNAQGSDHSGIITSTLTISPGFIPSTQTGVFYFHGLMEVYPEARVSVRGDGTFLMGSSDSALLANHGLYFGPLYHFTSDKNIDPYLGIQPGAHFVQKQINGTQTAPAVLPVVKITGGVRLYLEKWVNFFLETAWVQGNYVQAGIGKESLGEIRFSGGLGFFLDVKK